MLVRPVHIDVTRPMHDVSAWLCYVTRHMDGYVSGANACDVTRPIHVDCNKANTC